MNKQKFTGILCVVIGFALIVVSAYFAISYTSNILNGLVDFVTTNDFEELKSCGVSIPDQMLGWKSDLTTTLLPSLYLGLPAVLILNSILMFLGGYYYHKGKHIELVEKRRMERDIRKVVKRPDALKPEDQK